MKLQLPFSQLCNPTTQISCPGYIGFISGTYPHLNPANMAMAVSSKKQWRESCGSWYDEINSYRVPSCIYKKCMSACILYMPETVTVTVMLYCCMTHVVGHVEVAVTEVILKNSTNLIVCIFVSTLLVMFCDTYTSTNQLDCKPHQEAWRAFPDLWVEFAALSSLTACQMKAQIICDVHIELYRPHEKLAIF